MHSNGENIKEKGKKKRKEKKKKKKKCAGDKHSHILSFPYFCLFVGWLFKSHGTRKKSYRDWDWRAMGKGG
jgi:hypothetical protein